MSYTYTKANWSGSQAVFVIEFEFGGSLRRYCSISSQNTITISDGANDVLIPFGIEGLDLTESINAGESIEENIVSIQLATSLPLMELWSRGITLEGVSASVYLFLEKLGSISQTWSEKVKIYEGIIEEPVFGDPQLQEGIVSFGIELQAWDASKFLLQGNYIDTRFPNRAESADGKIYPVVIGNPGYQVVNEIGVKVDMPAFPAYCNVIYAGLGTDASFVISAGIVESSGLRIYDQNSKSHADVVLTGSDSYGRAYSSTDIPIGGGSIALPGDDVNGVSQAWWCHFTDSAGGIASPYQAGSLTLAGDVLRWALSKTGQRIDEGAFANLSNFLNRYKLAGYINNSAISGYDWLAGNLLPLLPISLRTGALGIKPVLNVLNAITQVEPICSISLGDNLECNQVSPVQVIRATSDIINDFTLIWGKNGMTQEYTQISRCRAIAVDPQDIVSEYSIISTGRYGIKPESYESDYIYDRATANLVAKDMIRARSLVLHQIEVEMPVYYGYLQIGDVLSVTSSFLYLTDHKMMITAKTWRDAQTNWVYILQFELNPIQNYRSK